jgi:hypothetical protein
MLVYVRGRSGECRVTCDSYAPVVTGRARRGPAVPDVVRTWRGPGLPRSWLVPVPFGRGRLRRSAPPRPGTGSAGRARQGRYRHRAEQQATWRSGRRSGAGTTFPSIPIMYALRPQRRRLVRGSDPADTSADLDSIRPLRDDRPLMKRRTNMPGPPGRALELAHLRALDNSAAEGRRDSLLSTTFAVGY